MPRVNTLQIQIVTRQNRVSVRWLDLVSIQMKHLERAVLTWKKKPEPNDEINLKANILLHSTQTISPKYTLKLKRFSLHCLWHCHCDSAHRSSMNAVNQLHWFGFWLKPTSKVLIITPQSGLLLLSGNTLTVPLCQYQVEYCWRHLFACWWFQRLFMERSLKGAWHTTVDLWSSMVKESFSSQVQSITPGCHLRYLIFISESWI